MRRHVNSRAIVASANESSRERICDRSGTVCRHVNSCVNPYRTLQRIRARPASVPVCKFAIFCHSPAEYLLQKVVPSRAVDLSTLGVELKVL
jgi:hypothetical protein